MSPTRRELVLARLVAYLARAAGLEDLILSADLLLEIGSQDLFNGQAEIDGHHVDSLALTETLVQAEEELDFSLFDDERADDARSLMDLIDIMLSMVPLDTVDTWLSQASADVASMKSSESEAK